MGIKGFRVFAELNLKWGWGLQGAESFDLGLSLGNVGVVPVARFKAVAFARFGV